LLDFNSQESTPIGSTTMTDRELMILGKLTLTFGCLLGLPLWEFWRLKRERYASAQEAREQEKKPHTSDCAGISPWACRHDRRK
jgi:hypothetical protein